VDETEFGFVPAARNLAHNPRPTSLTHMTVTGGTQALSTEFSFSGNQSVRVVLGASQSWKWMAAADDDPDLASIPGDTTIYMAARVLGSAVGNWQAIGRIRYTDGTSSAAGLSGLGITLSPTAFTRIDWDRVVTAGKTVRNVEIEFTTGVGVSLSVFVGGLDIRTSPIDAFVHGDGGTHYAWEGTANNSPSVREAFAPTPIFGHGGQIFPTIAVHVVNRQNQVQRDITEHFRDGSVSYDLDADQHKGSCQLTFDEPGLVEPLADEYVRLTLRIAKADGSVSEGPLGMFIVDPPRERWVGGHDEWQYQGKDMLSILSTFMFRGVVLTNVVDGEAVVEGSYGFVEGTSYRAALTDILTNHLGFSALQYSFSGAMPQEADEAIGWEAGTDALTIVSDILEGAGWQKPWVTPNGIITSAPAGTNPAVITPSVVLATGDNSPLRWPFEVDTDASEVGNRVRVVSARDVVSVTRQKKRKKKKKKRGGGTTKVRKSVERWWSNTDPSHPLSFPRLGRWIDLPDKAVRLVQNENEADQIGKQVLIDASQVPITARITTEVMLRGLNEVYELDITDARGEPIESGQGRYFCRGWSIQLGPPWEMVHSLTRTIDFAAAPFLGD
jgi:hypothetical protein